VAFAVLMPERTSLTASSPEIKLDFVEREATPRELMRLSIQLHLRGLSLSDTVRVLERFGVERARSTVHNWVQKAELQPADGKSPDHVAVDETVIKLTDERYWLFAAVDPATNEFLHVRLFPTRNAGLTGIFLAELGEKHDIDDAHRFSRLAQRSSPPLRLRVSLRTPRPPQQRRTCLPRGKTAHLPVWKLLQERRSRNRRKMAAGLRLLLESATLNNARDSRVSDARIKRHNSLRGVDQCIETADVVDSVEVVVETVDVLDSRPLHK